MVNIDPKSNTEVSFLGFLFEFEILSFERILLNSTINSTLLKKIT